MERDSLGVERAEMLRMIEDLERVVEGLNGVNAGVSSECANELQRLRKQVEKEPQSPSKWRGVLDFAAEVLAKIAAELLKALL